MPFDGVDYADALLIPKLVTHPDAPLVGTCYGRGLRNSYFRERHHGTGGPTWAVPGDFERRPGTDLGARFYGVLRAAAARVAEVARWVPGHYTHALCHVAFAAVQGEGGIAGWQLRAGSSPASLVDLGPTVDVPLTAERAVGVLPQANLPGDTDLVLYEVIIGVELADTPLDQLVHLQVRAGADEENEAGARQSVGLELLSFSFWFESVG